ncbi:MAG: hypothetical protein AAB815_01555 [Patescibacteria group bacterium]
MDYDDGEMEERGFKMEGDDEDELLESIEETEDLGLVDEDPDKDH